MKKKSFWHRSRIRMRAKLRGLREFWRDLDNQVEVYHQERTQHPDFFFERPLD